MVLHSNFYMIKVVSQSIKRIKCFERNSVVLKDVSAGISRLKETRKAKKFVEWSYKESDGQPTTGKKYDFRQWGSEKIFGQTALSYIWRLQRLKYSVYHQILQYSNVCFKLYSIFSSYISFHGGEYTRVLWYSIRRRRFQYHSFRFLFVPFL